MGPAQSAAVANTVPAADAHGRGVDGVGRQQPLPHRRPRARRADPRDLGYRLGVRRLRLPRRPRSWCSCSPRSTSRSRLDTHRSGHVASADSTGSATPRYARRRSARWSRCACSPSSAARRWRSTRSSRATSTTSPPRRLHHHRRRLGHRRGRRCASETDSAVGAQLADRRALARRVQHRHARLRARRILGRVARAARGRGRLLLLLDDHRRSTRCSSTSPTTRSAAASCRSSS